MAKRKIYNLSYFIYRLSEVGINSKVVTRPDSAQSTRHWEVLLLPQQITCRCHIVENKLKSFDFSIPGIENKFSINTKSMNVIIEWLKGLSVNGGVDGN